MKTGIVALLAGIVFSIGLGISGMTNPNKVLHFLDLFGNWDPSLAFVMAGAMTTYLIGYKSIFPRFKKPLYGSEFLIPHKKEIDKPLVIGSALFGIGWGLSGFCPGPGITSLVSMSEEAIVFILSMVSGMLVFHYGTKLRKYEDG